MKKYLKVGKAASGFLLLLAIVSPNILPISEAYAAGTLSVTLSSSSQNVTTGTPVTLVAQVTDGGATVNRPTSFAIFFEAITRPFTYIGQAIASIFGRTASNVAIQLQPQSQLAQVPNPSAFTYTLAQNATTSAGIYRKSDDVLVRTLWSSEPKNAGSHSSTWDGKNDFGNTAPGAPTDYMAKILNHNVKYVWEGTVGNSSIDPHGPYRHRSFYFINDMAISGNDGYLVTGYAELQKNFYYFDASQPNRRLPFSYEDYRRAFTKVATDGTNTYFANNDGAERNGKFIVGFTKPNYSGYTELGIARGSGLPDPQINFAYGVPAGSPDSPWKKVLDYQGSPTTGLDVQKNGSYLIAAKATDNKLIMFDKGSGKTEKNFTIESPLEIASDSNNDLWVAATLGGYGTGDINFRAWLQRKTSITLDWDKRADFNGNQFVISRSLSASGTPTVVAKIHGDSTMHVDQGLTPGTVYYYQIYKENTDTGAKSSVLSASAKTSTQDVVYRVTNLSGTPTIANTISGFSHIKDIAVSPDNTKLAVVDAGTNHQIKIYSAGGVNIGALLQTHGKVGGQKNNTAVIADDVFDFTGSFLAFTSTGDLWVGDNGNSRALKFNPSFAVLDTLMYTGAIYTGSVVINNPARVFGGWYEYQVDYSKPLDPTNGSWKLTRNWEASLPSKVTKSTKGFSPQHVIKLPNGKTYALFHISNTQDPSHLNHSYYTMYELLDNGTAIEYIPYLQTEANFMEDGSMAHQDLFSGEPHAIERLKLTFDSNNNPIWDQQRNSESFQRQGEAVAVDTATTSYTGLGYYAPHVASSGSTLMTDSGKVVFFTHHFYRNPENLQNGGQLLTNAWHLGAKNRGSSSWAWLASPPGVWVEQGHVPPITTLDYWNYGSGYIINPKGTFDYGPNAYGIPGSSGYPSYYAGITALGNSIIYTYHGEFWGSGQANQKIHYHDNGLFIGQFGRTLYSTVNVNTAMPERSGNSFATQMVKVNGKTYFYNNDESAHGAVHRWRIDNLDSVNIITAELGGGTSTFPIAAITSPIQGTIFSIPTDQTTVSIPISATASDTDGTITKVEFYNGGTKLFGGEDTQAPYTYTWGNVSQGSYTLTTRATDNAGNVGVSSPVSISVQNATVEPTTYKVEFFAGTTKIGEDLASPFSGAWIPTVAGTYAITARVTRSSDGVVANSSPVSIVVNPVTTATGDLKLARYSSTNALLPASFGADVRVNSLAATTTNPVTYTNLTPSSNGQLVYQSIAVKQVPGYKITRAGCVYDRGATECDGLASPGGFYVLDQCVNGWCNDMVGVTAGKVTKIFYKYVSGVPTITFTATPTTVSSGGSTVLTWSATATNGSQPCIASNAWTGKKSASGSQTISGITAQKTFELVCTNGVGSGYAKVVVPVSNQTNQPPIVSLVYTGPSGAVYRGDTLPWTVTASDPDGSISKVEFYADDQLNATDTTSPYNFSWTVPISSYVSTHTFYAIAYDNLNEDTQSNIARGNISTLRESDPVIVINPKTFTAPANVTIDVINDYYISDAEETGLNIQKLEFYRGATKIGEDTSYPYTFTDANVPAGSYAYTALLWANWEGGPIESSVSNIINVTVTSGTPPPGGTTPGLKAEYFNNKTWSGTPTVTKIDSNINFDWGNNAPATGVNVDEFSVRWTGKVIPRYSENYTFHFSGDDGISLKVNGQDIGGWWVGVPMIAGQQYDIEVKHYENFGGANAKLEWESPSQAREVVPTSQLKTATLARLTDDTLVAAVLNSTEPMVRGIAIASVILLLGVGMTLIVKRKH